MKCSLCNMIFDSDDPSMTKRKRIYQCCICDMDICGNCAESHSKDHTGLDWE